MRVAHVPVFNHHRSSSIMTNMRTKARHISTVKATTQRLLSAPLGSTKARKVVPKSPSLRPWLCVKAAQSPQYCAFRAGLQKQAVNMFLGVLFQKRARKIATEKRQIYVTPGSRALRQSQPRTAVRHGLRHSRGAQRHVTATLVVPGCNCKLLQPFLLRPNVLLPLLLTRVMFYYGYTI